MILKKFLNLFLIFFAFIEQLFLQRRIVIAMAKREISTQYVGSMLGFVWTFVQPVVTVSVYWLVFSIAFKVQPKNDVPFVAWLIAGIASWSLFAEIVTSSSNVVVSNAHLIKKTVFNSEILPVVRILSCIITHWIFLTILFVLMVFLKIPFTWYHLQFIYYLFCMVVLGLGLSWAVSSLNVFVRDVAKITEVLMQIGFWGTGIFFDVETIPEHFRFVFFFNPMFYVVQGYRESFFYQVPFWHHPYQTLYFWCVTAVIFVCGALIFKKMKPQFTDVL